MQDRTCPGDTMLTFMARNERYMYDEDEGMRLQERDGGENHEWQNENNQHERSKK